MVEDRGLVLVVLRGDHQVNEIKLANALGAPFRAAREDEFAQRIGPAGSMGPVGADVPVLLDDAVAPGPYVAGANRDGTHLQGVEPGRDFPFKRADVRRVVEGDTVGGHPIRIEPAIEVGNIFKLGTRFSEPLGATYLDESGAEQLIWMGSYGIGPARICAAAVEQFADEQGISWPRAIAPFDVHLVGLGKAGTEERALAERLYGELQEAGLDVIYDDREDIGPGGKFADAELLGCPLRLTAGKRSLASGRARGPGAARPGGPGAAAGGRRGGGGGAVADPGLTPSGTDRAREQMQEAAEKARLTFRRLSGLDRSGPPPPETLAGQPWRVWTIPNAIGFVRLALLPVFLVLAFQSEDGTDLAALIIFAVIGWSDYLDGITARLTGQYSRFGALLDPLVDRLLVISGVVVCWHFELLPHWALAVLVAREVFVMGLVRWGLNRGLDVKVNWWGRAGVWPIMTALFLAMAGVGWVAEACLYLGLVLVLGATVLYLREAIRLTREQGPSSSA